MSEDDKELEQSKKRRLTEMEKNIALKQRLEEIPISKKTQPSAREILVKNLGYRGLEVLQNAESQFPSETKIDVEQDGEFCSLSDKLTSKSSNNETSIEDDLDS